MAVKNTHFISRCASLHVTEEALLHQPRQRYTQSDRRSRKERASFRRIISIRKYEVWGTFESRQRCHKLDIAAHKRQAVQVAEITKPANNLILAFISAKPVPSQLSMSCKRSNVTHARCSLCCRSIWWVTTQSSLPSIRQGRLLKCRSSVDDQFYHASVLVHDFHYRNTNR